MPGRDPDRKDVVIAGFPKTGTTSLFVSLSTHPLVAPSAVKETRYFLPARYGRPLEPFAVYEGHFAGTGSRPVRLEATPNLVYGGDDVIGPMRERLTNPHVVLVLREPVSRAISYFEYQKTRLRFPADLPIEEYLATATALGDADLRRPEQEKYLAVLGGKYADVLPPWLDAFGPALHVTSFETLVSDPAGTLDAIAQWLHLDPAGFPDRALSSENRTTGYRSRTFQRFALGFNDRLERLLRRHPAAKRRLRALYYRLNGRPLANPVPDTVRAELAEAFREPNRRLAAQLLAAGVPLPPWLAAESSTASAVSGPSTA